MSRHFRAGPLSSHQFRQKTKALAELGELERLRLAHAASGQTVYDWTIADDRIVWCDNATNVLPIADVKTVASHRRFCKLTDSSAQAFFAEMLRSTPEHGENFIREYRVSTPRGEIWVEDRGVCLKSDEKLERIVGTLTDITQRKAREKELSYLAAYDELTGQLNRLRLREHLTFVLQRAEKEKRPCAFAVAAVDGLASLNEAYGFDIADEVIVAVSRRLASAIGPDDAIGRVGGNKFGIVFAECDADGIARAAALLRETIAGSVIKTSAGAVSVTISLGFVPLPGGAETSQEAMLRGEEALERAKSSGRDTFHVYSASPDRQATRKRNLMLGEEVISALNERRLVLAYQPIVQSGNRQTAFYECLLRMVRPDGQIAPAGDFIAVCEQLGLVRLVDRRVLEMAIETLFAQQDAHLSINVSGVSVGDPHWRKLFDDVVRIAPDVVRRLTVELTETAALQDLEDTESFVHRIREAGARVAIDDFGAGYTSFRNLQILDIDLVKIDGTFVKNLSGSKDNQAFVRTLVDLAKNFEIATVAEWVGNEEDVRLLQDYGVDYLQGFYFGAPTMTPPWVDANTAAK